MRFIYTVTTQKEGIQLFKNAYLMSSEATLLGSPVQFNTTQCNCSVKFYTFLFCLMFRFVANAVEVLTQYYSVPNGPLKSLSVCELNKVKALKVGSLNL